MTTRYAIDVLYAWAQFGLPPGTGDIEIRNATSYARIYRFTTKTRLEQVNRFAQFFIERGRFGRSSDAHDAIRKAYYRRAMELHPDRNPNDARAMERLKDINAAYELVEEIHKEARAYFDKSDDERRAIEHEARAQALREAEAAGAGRTVNMPYEEAETRAPDAETERPEPPRKPPRPPGSIKYMAASIPRFIRASRLFYLGRDSIIGSRMVRSPGAHHGYVYDIIMLTELEFRRARLRLSMEGYGIEELTMSKLTPPYIPIDTKELIVSPDELDPAAFAKRYFLTEYGLL